MKKFISVILMISFILLTLIGCSNQTPDDTDNDPTPAFVDVIKDYDKIDDSSTEGFTVKAKKYDYEENNIVLLSVENHSKNNYTVTVDMAYYDAGGNEITKESQSFEGFAANWQKYFLFQPSKTFASYEYTLVTEEFNGECLGNKFTFRFDGIKEDRADLGLDENGTPIGIGKGLTGYMAFRFEYPGLLDLWANLIFFDNKGEIYYIDTVGQVGNKPPYIDNYITPTLVTGTKNSVEWPEELKAETTGIVVLKKVEVRP